MTITILRNELKELTSIRTIESCNKLIALSDAFVALFPRGVSTEEELDLGVDLVRKLVSASYITSTKEFEHDHRLYRNILRRKIQVFKMCIPQNFSKLRGITELLVGMKENELSQS
jgi:hypothetical protein